MIVIIILYAIFAIMTFINTSLMTSDPYPLLIGMLRAFGSGLLILGGLLLFSKEKITNLKLSSRQWYLLIAYGILIHGFAMCGFSYGLMYANPITACFLYASGPFLTTILLYFDNRTVLSTTKIVGLLIGCFGLIPVLLKSSHNAEVLVPDKQWLGNIIILVSMLFFCWGWILYKKLILSCTHSVQVINAVAMLIGGILSALFVILLHGRALFEITFSDNFLTLMTLFIIANLLTYSLYAYLLQRFSPTFISFAGFLEPAFALIYGFFLFGYTIGIVDIISFILLFIGLYIFYRQELQET